MDHRRLPRNAGGDKCAVAEFIGVSQTGVIGNRGVAWTGRTIRWEFHGLYEVKAAIKFT